MSGVLLTRRPNGTPDRPGSGPAADAAKGGNGMGITGNGEIAAAGGRGSGTARAAGVLGTGPRGAGGRRTSRAWEGGEVSHPRQIAAAGVGNAAESYDWYAYSFLVTIFSARLFPHGAGAYAPLLWSLAVFAVGFFVRPLGGLLLGSFADRHGRRAALMVTVLMMGAGSLLMAVVPTYRTAGPAAPALLVVARIVQGLSLGGEYAASSTYLVESAPPGRRGLYSSLQYVSITVGQLAASGFAVLLTTFLSGDQLASWGWRMVFLLGALLSFSGFWLRRSAAETRPGAPSGPVSTGVPAPDRPRVFEALIRYPKQSLLIAGATMGGTVAYYTWTAYLSTYAQVSGGISTTTALRVSSVSLVFFALLQPLMGTLSDRIGRRPLLLGFSGAMAVLSVPLLGLAARGPWSMLAASLTAMVALSAGTAVMQALNVELFPRHVRVAGIGFPYSVSVALFGGTAPYVATWLRSVGHAPWFGWWMVLLCTVSLAVFTRIPETAHRPLP